MADAAPIFISYRRSDAAGHARALYRDLSGRFGAERIFFDRTTIEGGDVFTDTIREGVEGCSTLLALIAPEWLEVKGADGNRRLEDPLDNVRQEIALALELGKKVIPVLFDDTPLPPADRLPEPLKALRSRDAVTLRGKTYEYAIQLRELVRLLAQGPGVPAPFPEAGEALASGVAQQLPAIIEAATRGLQQLNDAQLETIRMLERQLGTNEAQLGAFFQTIGEAQVPPEQQPARLIEIAAQYRQLQAQLAARPGDEPEVAKLKEAARTALDAGRLQEADDLLKRVEGAQDALLDQQQREIERQQTDRAATAAQRGGIALTRLRYREAGEHFAAAARRVPPAQEEQALAYLDYEAKALYRQGDEFGDNVALMDAIGRCRALLDRLPRDRLPLDWARTQTNLGLALTRLGERETGTACLEDAVVALHAALEEYTRERVPLQWAITQNNLGTTLWRLGERDGGTARLEEAVEAYRAALEERTRERVPLDWATTQNNLGNALSELGERESGTAFLKEAVAAYREALKEFTRERVPLQWARALNNLGLALLRLGERESSTARLKMALAAFREALRVLTRERVPLQWAGIQNNLGLAFKALGELVGSTALLKAAVAAYRDALKEYTRERVALEWAMAQSNLGGALRGLGEQESDTARLEEAVAALRDALEELPRERVPLEWARTQNNLGLAFKALGELEGDTGSLKEAVAAYRETLKEYTHERVPLQWARTQNNLGIALAMLGARTEDVLKLKAARDAIAAAFEVFMQAGQEHYRAYFEERLRDLDRRIAELTHPG